MFGLDNKKQVEITISNNTMLRAVLFLLGTILFLRIFDSLRHPLTLIFVSFFLAIALNPAVAFISNKLKSKSRIRATAISYGVVTLVLLGFIVLIVPPLVGQTTDYINELPLTITELSEGDSSIGSIIRKYELQEQVDNFANDWSRNLGSVQGPVINTANRIFLNVVSIITVFVLTFMMLVEGPKWTRTLWKYVPKNRRKHDQIIAAKMYKVITSYVNGQVLVALIGSIFALVTLVITSTLFNVSVNVLALTSIVFLFGLVPTVGAIISAVLVTLLVLFVSPAMAVVMLIYFIVYQQIENATVQPYIQAKVNELTPMLVFIAAVVGFSIGGILGGFLAIPILGCAKVLLDDQIEQRNQTNTNSEEKSKA